MESPTDPPSPSPRPPVQPPSSYPPPPPPGYPPVVFAAPRQGGALGRALVGVFVSLLVVSLLTNVYLVLALSSMAGGLRESEYQAGDAAHRIVILPIKGLIDDDTAAFVRQALAELREDRPAAVILRVDSGGGYVSPSDRIWHELVEFKKQTNLPVLASFGGLAASGGYYISAPCDLIVAEPTCLTGSIGVMAQGFTIDQLLAKVGVTPEVLVATTSPRKDIANDISRPWTEEDRQVMTAILDHLHAQFVEVVAHGRSAHLPPDQVRRVADGRVFNADEAAAEKLIDEIGYLDRAIELASQRANLAANIKPQVTVISRPQPLLGSLLQSRSAGPGAALDGQAIRQWATEWSVPQMMYLWQGR